MQITTWYTVRKIMCNAELHSKNHPYAILSWTLYLIFGLKISVGQALCVLCFLFAVPPTQNTQKACPRLSLDRKRVKIIIWLFLFHHGASYGVGWHGTYPKKLRFMCILFQVPKSRSSKIEGWVLLGPPENGQSMPIPSERVWYHFLGIGLSYWPRTVQ